jgi:hypothetical protein
MRLRIVTYLQAMLGMAALASTAIEGRAEPENLAKVEFDQANLDEIVEFFRAGGGLEGQSRNILVDPALDNNLKVTLVLHDVSLGVAFAYAAEVAGFDYREEKHALRIFPLKAGKPPVRGFLKRGSPMTARRASEIMMPKVEFDATELGQAIDDLRAASRQLDPKMEGLNLILGHGVDPATKVTLSLQNVPVAKVLKYVADFARLDMRIDGPAIVFTNRMKVSEQ